MRRLTTVICCLAFALSGICLANMTSEQRSANAAPTEVLPTLDINKMSLPLDLQLNRLAQKEDKSVPVKTDTVYVEKTKLVKVNTPGKIKTKTVHVPVLYIATYADNKEDTASRGPTALYKVRKVGDCDLNQIISSVGVK